MIKLFLVVAHGVTGPQIPAVQLLVEMDWRHGNVALLSMTRTLPRYVKPKRDRVQMESVLDGDHGQFGVLARLHVGYLEETPQRKSDIDVGTLKQVLELIAMLIMNQLHVNAIQKNANSSVNGDSGANGVIVIRIALKVSS